jgi:hypothetical protein
MVDWPTNYLAEQKMQADSVPECTGKYKKRKGPPEFWQILSQQDQKGYLDLRDFLDQLARHRRGARSERFDAALEAIVKYVNHGDENDWQRSLVSGFFLMNGAVAINARRLARLLSKCKSWVNGSLQRLGYVTNMSHSETWKALFQKIPFLVDHCDDLKQWTLRCRMPKAAMRMPKAAMRMPLVMPSGFHATTVPQPRALPVAGSAYVLPQLGGARQVEPLECPRQVEQRDAMTETRILPEPDITELLKRKVSTPKDVGRAILEAYSNFGRDGENIAVG